MVSEVLFPQSVRERIFTHTLPVPFDNIGLARGIEDPFPHLPC